MSEVFISIDVLSPVSAGVQGGSAHTIGKTSPAEEKTPERNRRSFVQA